MGERRLKLARPSLEAGGPVPPSLFLFPLGLHRPLTFGLVPAMPAAPANKTHHQMQGGKIQPAAGREGEEETQREGPS